MKEMSDDNCSGKKSIVKMFAMAVIDFIDQGPWCIIHLATHRGFVMVVWERVEM